MMHAWKDMNFVAALAFRTAWQFEQVADLLNQRKLNGIAMMTPMVVNVAFAIEVYLKCLYMIEQGRNPKEARHDLANLYKIQAQESQRIIKDLYDQHMAIQPEWAYLSITTVLEWAKDAFVEWRYRYEDNKSSAIANVDVICEAIRERIIQLKPDWKNLLTNDLE